MIEMPVYEPAFLMANIQMINVTGKMFGLRFVNINNVICVIMKLKDGGCYGKFQRRDNCKKL